MSRLLLLLSIATLSLIAFAGCQTTKTDGEASTSRHPDLVFDFPPSLAGMERVGRHDYEPRGSGLGYSERYHHGDGRMDIYVYDLQQAGVAPGVDSALVRFVFQQAIDEVFSAGRSGAYAEQRKVNERSRMIGKWNSWKRSSSNSIKGARCGPTCG